MPAVKPPPGYPEEPQRRFPGAQPIEGTLEVRNLGGSPDEILTIGDPRPPA